MACPIPAGLGRVVDKVLEILKNQKFCLKKARKVLLLLEKCLFVAGKKLVVYALMLVSSWMCSRCLPYNPK